MDELQTAIAELQSSNPDILELALDKIGTIKPDNALKIIVPLRYIQRLKNLAITDSLTKLIAYGTGEANLAYKRVISLPFR